MNFTHHEIRYLSLLTENIRMVDIATDVRNIR